MRNSDFRPTACEARALQDASSTLLEKAGILRPLDAGFFHLLGIPYSALVLSVQSCTADAA